MRRGRTTGRWGIGAVAITAAWLVPILSVAAGDAGAWQRLPRGPKSPFRSVGYVQRGQRSGTAFLIGDCFIRADLRAVFDLDHGESPVSGVMAVFSLGQSRTGLDFHAAVPARVVAVGSDAGADVPPDLDWAVLRVKPCVGSFMPGQFGHTMLYAATPVMLDGLAAKGRLGLAGFPADRPLNTLWGRTWSRDDPGHDAGRPGETGCTLAPDRVRLSDRPSGPLAEPPAAGVLVSSCPGVRGLSGGPVFIPVGPSQIQAVAVLHCAAAAAGGGLVDRDCPVPGRPAAPGLRTVITPLAGPEIQRMSQAMNDDLHLHPR
jgi:hypothetical protein